MDVSNLQAIAPSPANGHQMIDLSIKKERVQQAASLGKRTDLFELFYNVCGIVPPVPHIGHHEKGLEFPDMWGGMRNTHAIFKGLKRPMNDDGLDKDVYVYILKPMYTYRYKPGMVCVAKRFPAPQNAVFAVYVMFQDDDYNKGEIFYWDWVLADSHNPTLPRGYNERYDQRIWSNG